MEIWVRSGEGDAEPGRPRLRRAVTAVVALYAAAVIAGFVLIHFMGDAWWIATPLMFGPRWVFAAPALALAPLALFARCRVATVAVVGAAALLALGPLMGLAASRAAFASSGAPREPRDIRLMTHNLDQTPPTSAAFLEVLADVAPDIVTLQECIPKESGKLELPGWYTHVSEQLCLLSRFPIRAVDERDRTDVWDRGGCGAMIRYEIETPRGMIDVLNVHLETVREGLEGLRHGDVAEMRANIAERTWESQLARGWADRATAPLLVGGDFNMPVESDIYRTYWSGFENAFSAAGLGYGATKETRKFGVRIDHILSGRGWHATRAWVGAPTGSSHRPMIADLRLSEEQ